MPKKYNYTKKPGRPSKYKPEFCQEMINFFNQEPYEDIKLPHYKNGKKTWEDIKRMPSKLPTMVEFVKSLNKNGVSIGFRTVYDWLDKKHSSFHEDFSQTFIYICKDLQKNFLNQNALQGLYNPLYSKFLAVNITDMRDVVSPLIDQSTHYHYTQIDEVKLLEQAKEKGITLPLEIERRLKSGQVTN